MENLCFGMLTVTNPCMYMYSQTLAQIAILQYLLYLAIANNSVIVSYLRLHLRLEWCDFFAFYIYFVYLFSLLY